MRKWKPNSPKLQQAWSARIDYPASNIDVGDRISVKQQVIVAQIIKKSSDGNDRGNLPNQKDFTAGRIRLRVFHSRWVSSRKTRKRASISPRVSDCRRSVPNFSTAND